MRLSEISKGTFQRKLQSQWFSELVDRINKFNEVQESNGWKATLSDDQNPMEIEIKRFKPGVNVTSLHTAEIEFIKTVLSPLGFEAGIQFYELDRLPVTKTKYPYVIYGVLQPVTETKLSKDEFVKRLQDPRRAAVEKKLKEWDDKIRNQFRWRVAWSEWELDPKTITVTAYRPRTLPVPTADTEEIHNDFYVEFAFSKWDERNGVDISIEDEDQDSLTWEFYLPDETK